MSDTEYSRLSTVAVGLRCRCPRCGEGPLLKGYLKIRESCSACGLSYAFADPADGPAFFAMSLVGVVGMAAFMAFEFSVHPPLWVHAVVSLPVLVLMCLAVLRPFKGWMVAEQYAHKAIESTFAPSRRPGDER